MAEALAVPLHGAQIDRPGGAESADSLGRSSGFDPGRPIEAGPSRRWGYGPRCRRRAIPGPWRCRGTGRSWPGDRGRGRAAARAARADDQLAPGPGGAGGSRLRIEAHALVDADLLPEGSTVPSTVAVAVPTEGARLQAVRLAAAPPAQRSDPATAGSSSRRSTRATPLPSSRARLDRRPGSPQVERAGIGTVAVRHHQADAAAGGAESVAAPLVTEARRRAAGPPRARTREPSTMALAVRIAERLGERFPRPWRP
jgi:hypothetical protein